MVDMNIKIPELSSKNIEIFIGLNVNIVEGELKISGFVRKKYGKSVKQQSVQDKKEKDRQQKELTESIKEETIEY